MRVSRIAAALVLGATALVYAADPETSTPDTAEPPAASAPPTPKAGPTPTAAHLRTAAQLLDLVHVDRTTKQTVDVLLKMQLQQQPKLQPYEDVLRTFLQKYMSWDSLKADYARIYAEAFTEDELRQIITFYKTPAGQKAINKIPTLMGMGAALGQKRVQENRAELQEMINAKKKEMEEHHAVP